MAIDGPTGGGEAPPIAELQERVQAPVRAANDIGGVLWGDWLSPPVTLLFVKLGVSPTVATIGMLVAGLAGCVLIALGGAYSVAGAALIVVFYILDCVDGEVARFHQRERFYWSYADFFFGVWTMSLFYVAVGVQAAVQTGIAWFGLLGAGCVIFFMTKKFIDVAHIFLTVQHLLLSSGPSAGKYRDEVRRTPAASENGQEPRSAGSSMTRRDIVSRYGGPAGVLRGMALNFHLGAAVFLALAIADLLITPLSIFGVAMNLKTLFLFPCFALIAANAVDYFLHDMRGGFMRKCRSLLDRL